MRKIGLISLALAASLLPSTVFAGRLDGEFKTEDSEFSGANQACTEVQGQEFSVAGTVIGTQTAGCIVTIEYATPFPHKASATALKSGKTEGSAKVSQSIESGVILRLAEPVEDPAVVTCLTATVIVGNPEKCKIDSSIKGDSATSPDSVDSGRVSVSCDLGDNGADLTVVGSMPAAPPSEAVFGSVVTAFDGRKDVKIDSKGKLKITQKGVPDVAGTTQACLDPAS